MGPPNRPEIQSNVLRQTLALVDQTSGPALVDYPDNYEDEKIDGDGWSCPVTFPTTQPETESDALKAQLHIEVQMLRPWFDEGLRRRRRSTVGVSGKGVDAISEMLDILVSFAVDADMTIPDGYNQPMPKLLRYLISDIRSFYSEAAISKPGARFPSPEDLEEWFFLETIAGDVFYRVRQRLVSADILVLIANGLNDDEIDSTLVLLAGTTSTTIEERLREGGLNRELLKSSAEDYQSGDVGRFSRSFVPMTMRDRRSERATFSKSS